jgi:Flp pilus assembly protein TadG
VITQSRGRDHRIPQFACLDRKDRSEKKGYGNTSTYLNFRVINTDPVGMPQIQRGRRLLRGASCKGAGEGRRGSAVIEFALSFTLLWLIVTGVFEFGYSMWIYNSLVSRVADAARFAARIDYDSRDSNEFILQVKNVAVYGNPEGTGTAVVPNLATSVVSVVLDFDASGIPRAVRVSISSYTINTIFHNFTFQNKPQVTSKHVGRFLS